MIFRLLTKVKDDLMDSIQVSYLKFFIQTSKVINVLFDRVFDEFNNEFDDKLERIYDDFLVQGNIRLIKEVERLLSENDSNYVISKNFEVCCMTGNISTVKLYYERHKVKINEHFNLMFSVCCQKNFLDVAKYLYEISKKDGDKINIHYDDDITFKEACTRNHLNVVKWLYEISSMDDNTKFDIHMSDELPFRTCCHVGNFELAKWLYEKSKENNDLINIRILNDEAFCAACLDGYYNIVHWLCKLEDKYSCEIVNGRFIYHIKSLSNDLRDLNNDEIFDQKIEDIFNEYGFETIKSKINECCLICLSDDERYWIKHNCNHCVCVKCYIRYNKCVFRCKYTGQFGLVKII
jgi:hypothetical protein